MDLEKCVKLGPSQSQYNNTGQLPETLQCIRQLLVPQAVMQIGLDKFVKEEAAIVPLAAVVRKSDAGGTQTRIRVT